MQKLINHLCAGNKHNKVFVKYQAQGGCLASTPPCVCPCGQLSWHKIKICYLWKYSYFCWNTDWDLFATSW